MPRVHDRGGWPTDEPIDMTEHNWSDWEQQTQALPGLLRSKGLITTDELRRGIESIPQETYESYSYHERWSASLETILTEKGVFTSDEIDAKVKEIDARWHANQQT